MERAQNRWKRRTALFLGGQAITLFGSTIVQMAIVWHVTLKTSSGGWVAAFTIAAYLPQFLISFFAGVWADRYDRKKLIILADGVIALATLMMFWAIPRISSEPLMLTALLATSIIRSLGAGVQTPAVNAATPSLAPEENLARVNGINATLQSIVQFAAPAVAGAVLSTGTFRSALLIDVATALLGVGLLSCVVLPKQEAVKENASVWAEMKAGIAYSFSDKTIGKILTVYGLWILLSVPAGFMAALLVSRAYGGGYWRLTAVELVGFAGMALGGAAMGIWGGFKSRVKTLAVGLLVVGATTVVMGTAPYFLLYLAATFAYSVAVAVTQTAVMTLVQEKAESATLGRVFGVMGAMYSGFLPLGMAIFGPLADIAPLQAIIVGSGVALILTTLGLRAKNDLNC